MKPKHLFWASIFIWALPFVKLWVDGFIDSPYKFAGLTSGVLMLISIIWIFIKPEKKVETPKYRLDVYKNWLFQSYDTTVGRCTAYEYNYVIMKGDCIIKSYTDVEEAYKQLEFLNKNVK